MRKPMFALAIAAGLAAPMAVPAHAGQWCQVIGSNIFCYPM
jgi:hypothetical protein